MSADDKGNNSRLHAWLEILILLKLHVKEIVVITSNTRFGKYEAPHVNLMHVRERKSDKRQRFHQRTFICVILQLEF